MPRPMSGPHGSDRANPQTNSLGRLNYPINIVFYSPVTGKAYAEFQVGRLEISTNLTVDDINGTKYFKSQDRRAGWAKNLAAKRVVSVAEGDYSHG